MSKFGIWLIIVIPLVTRRNMSFDTFIQYLISHKFIVIDGVDAKAVFN